MKIPRYLKKGDTIGIAAPARKISLEEIQPTITLFETMGYSVLFEETLFAKENQFAGGDQIRKEGFQHLLDNPNVSAIICARGGYGSARIIDLLDFSTFQKNPKWICGYSDATVFHCHIHQNYNIATLHSTMPINIGNDKKGSESAQQIIAFLEGKMMNYQIDTHPLNRKGEAEGVLVGGNLSILYSLNGTSSDLDTADKILFIEDLDEYLYHIDRMVLNLKRSGKLSHIKGLIVGGMSEMRDNTIPFGINAEQIIRNHCELFDFPICFGFPAGHISDNRPLKLGVNVRFSVSEKGSFLIEKNIL
ncbi:MAG: putative MccF-like protein (microcin resistance) [Bacteroidetes bacterium]|nr:putative MccF-like protein (microcin resistance) [Bacteroidota bacterium]